MKLSRILAILLALCMLAASALALTPEEAEKSVVRVLVLAAIDPEHTSGTDENGRYYEVLEDDQVGFSHTGTAWAVGELGKPAQYFVTNRHVASDPDDVYPFVFTQMDKASKKPVLSSDGNPVQAIFEAPASEVRYFLVYTNITEIDLDTDEVIRVAASDRADLAVLKLASPTSKRTPSVLRPYDTLPKQDVYALGFPGVVDDFNLKGDLDSTDVHSTKGRINSFYPHEKSGAGDQFHMDANVTPGNSGGPVVDATGCVLGVSVTISVEDPELQQAISVNEVVTLLDKHNIPYTTADQAGIPAPDPNGGGGGGTVINNNIPVEYIIGAAVALGILIVAALVILTKGRTKKELAALKAAEEAARKAAEDAARKAAIAAELAAQKAVDEAARRAAEDAARAAALNAQNAAQKAVQMESTIAMRHKKPGFHEIKTRSLYGEVGALAGKSFPLNGTVTIGRDPQSTIPLPINTAGVSGRHCTIQVNNGVVTVTDNGSSYGTWIDNVRLPPNRPIIMHRGHKLYLGSKQQVFVLRS